MSLNVMRHRGRPVPYSEFSEFELKMSIDHALQSIEYLSKMDTPTARFSIEVLQKNIHIMQKTTGVR